MVSYINTIMIFYLKSGIDSDIFSVQYLPGVENIYDDYSEALIFS